MIYYKSHSNMAFPLRESLGALLDDCSVQMISRNGCTYTGVLGNERLNDNTGTFSTETVCHIHHTDGDALYCG